MARAAAITKSWCAAPSPTRACATRWSRPKAASPAIGLTAPKCRSMTRQPSTSPKASPSVLAGKEYGSGSSRDWAATGPRLLGVQAVIAESYERIHRSNLVGMGILPLQFLPGDNAETLQLSGEEVFEIAGIRDVIEHFTAGRKLPLKASRNGAVTEFQALVRIDTPQEALYYANGGILQYVLRQLLAAKPETVHA